MKCFTICGPEFYKVSSRASLKYKISIFVLSLLCFFEILPNQLHLYLFPTDICLLVYAIETIMKYQDPVLPVPTSTIDFKIYHCDRDGRPDMRYKPDAATSVCVRHICDLARSMVKSANGRQGFMGLATQYSQERPNAWFLRSPGTKEDNTKDAVKYFLGLFDDDFTGIVVSDAERNANNIAVHFRLRWDGQFKLSEQYIFLNGVVSKN